MLHVVTGGSGSGKSAYAETELLRLAKQNNCKKYYIATMEPFGNETLKKIARHREMRKDKGFDTLERYVDLKGTAEMLTDRPAVLLECMSNLTANEIYRPDGAGEQTADSIVDGVEDVYKRQGRDFGRYRTGNCVGCISGGEAWHILGRCGSSQYPWQESEYDLCHRSSCEDISSAGQEKRNGVL